MPKLMVSWTSGQQEHKKRQLLIMKFVKCIFGIISLLVINSCKNDLKLNAPYKEIPSIFAVLNPNENIQMIRINKVFQGESDANALAQVADSINYPAGELTVTLEHSSYGVKDIATPTGNKYTINFRDSVVQAADGSFNKTQRVYVSSDKLFPSGEYHLSVKNIRTGNTFTAIATAHDSVRGRYAPMNPPYYPYLPNPSNKNEFIDYGSSGYDGGSVAFGPNNDSIYQLIIRFHFYDSLYDHSKNFNYVDYNFTSRNRKDAENLHNQGYLISYSFKKADMFYAIGIGLSKMNLSTNIYGRKVYKIQYLLYTATQDYIDYLQYVTPSLSIITNKPLYSNFNDRSALGIFTFRTRCSVNKEIAAAFVDEFSRNSKTCSYKFYSSGLTLLGCN